CRGCQQDFCTPQDCIRHPIADSGKTVLHEQNGFDRRFTVSMQKLRDEFKIEVWRSDFGNIAPPPIRFTRPMMKAHPTKLSRVGEDQRTFTLVQNEMVVFVWAKILRFDADFARHAEMNAEPAPNVFASPDGFGVVAEEY